MMFAQCQNIVKPKIQKSLTASKPKEINRMVKIGLGYVCLKEIHFSLNDLVFLLTKFQNISNI